MALSPGAAARTMNAVAAPAVTRRRPMPGTREARRNTPSERLRIAGERTRWYLTKWFRQMVNVLTHPEEGFWDLKRTGDWGAVVFMMALVVIARMLVMQFMAFHYIFQGVEKTKWNFEHIMYTITSSLTLGMTNFFYGGNPEDTSVIQEGVRILLPFITWCIAHYAIAMIFYGEGSLKDVCLSAAYSLSPYIVFSWGASLILTNATTLSERTLYMGVSWIINLWIIYLFFVHIRAIHDFTVKRTLATYALGLLSVLIIWALAALVYALSLNTWDFIYGLFYEFTTR